MNQGVNTKEENLFIPGLAGLLESRVFGFAKPPKNDKPKEIMGIVCHPHPLYQGTMENKVVTTVIKAFQECHLSTIRFNFRGVGKSEGTYGDGIGEAEDLRSVVKWAQKQKPDALLYLAGFSFGSAIAATIAKELSSTEGLITIAPPITHADFSKKIPACPWLILQGDQDEIVPVDKVKSWFELERKAHPTIELIIMPNATHFFHGQLPILKKHIIDWMNC